MLSFPRGIQKFEYSQYLFNLVEKGKKCYGANKNNNKKCYEAYLGIHKVIKNFIIIFIYLSHVCQ